MSKKITIVAVLAVLVVLLFTQGSNASTQTRTEFWNFYASKETPCYTARYDGSHWIISFDKPLKPFAKGEFISNSFIGTETYISANGVKTEFSVFEIEVGGVVFPIAVLSTDLNRIAA